MQTTRTTLNANWRFKELNPRGGAPSSDVDWLDALVPGHVHIDLQKNGVIGDPFFRIEERGCAWVDEVDWVYETTFHLAEAQDSPPAYLRFHGLDTIAEIYLNGVQIGASDNMFVPHEFAVDGRLVVGANTLQVIFRSAMRIGKERQKAWMESCAPDDTLPEPNWARWSPRSFVRKAQYMYGWDWGPELVSCGIWQPVELVTIPAARILDWKYAAETGRDGGAIVRVTAEIERAPGFESTPMLFRAGLAAIDSESSGLGSDFRAEPAPIPAGSRVTVTQELLGPPLISWNPNGPAPVGEKIAQLYTLNLSACSESADFDSVVAKIGFRTVELIRERDSDGAGEGFKFRINGRDLFIKGANWIPHDSFPSRVNRSRLLDILSMARDAGFNMLRVWGGGLYESEEFYAICDSLGILAWQDFTYGCAYYPDKANYADSARVEATAAVRRIRNHPCLALWCGNNENAEMFHDQWGKADGVIAPRHIGEHIYYEVLPAVVEAENPETPYWPSSPWSGRVDINPQSEDYGDRHNWNVWHTKGATMEGVEPGDWPNYLLDRGRFSSEFGFASSCGISAWEKCTAPEDRWPQSPVVRWHDKTRKGYEKYLHYIGIHFPDPLTLEDLVYYSQINQAEALKCGIEHWRRSKGRCWGTLFWQLNDCWPVQSWAVVDSECEPKAAYYACKRFYAPLLVSLVRTGDKVEAHLVNDLLDDIQGELTLTAETFDGDVLLSETFDGFVNANSSAHAGDISVAALKVHERSVYIWARFEPFWDVGIESAENSLFLAEPKDLKLSDPGLSVRITEEERGFALSIRAERFAPYVWWQLDGLAPIPGVAAGDNFFHLRAGKERTIRIPKSAMGAAPKCPSDALARLRLRSL